MQLELNFNQKDLHSNATELFNNIYSIIICMQIVSKTI